MRELNRERVVFYGRNDLFVGAFEDRCKLLCLNAEKIDFASINDAIEAYQTKLTIEGSPELFQDQSSDDCRKCKRVLFSKAHKFVSSELESKGIGELYDQVECQYRKAFWQLIDSCDAWRKIKSANLEQLLEDHPECLGIILKYKKSLTCFSNELKCALINNPRYSAELIVGHLAVESTDSTNFYLPKNLENSEINDIMIRYMGSKDVNPNYLSVLRNWPSGKVSQYSPSPEVRVRAKRQYEKSMADLFCDGSGFKYSTGIVIDMNQDACRGVTMEGLDSTYSFSGRWLKEYMDFATVMNNLIYVFDFVDLHGLMRAPARQHEACGVLETLGMRAKGEYREPIGFQMRSGLTYVETMAYANFLEDNGVRLESAIEWVYNQYFADEFGIAGFSLALPSQTTTWLDKCKAIGPEIERAVKAYSLYSKNGVIDDEYFPHENVKTFSSLVALKDKKYAVAGPNFEKFGSILFSDQCMLAYLRVEKINKSSFFEMMVEHPVTRGDYPEYLQADLSELIENGFVIERDEDGRLLPTDYAVCLKAIWENDAMSLFRLEKKKLEVVESLVGRRIVSYCDKLFAPFEADYLDYMFKDVSFSNSLGLRNRYDHANSSIENPQADNIKDDYFKLLSLLISITLKINEELMRKTGQGGLDVLVDWQYYDKSVLRTAQALHLAKQGEIQ